MEKGMICVNPIGKNPFFFLKIKDQKISYYSAMVRCIHVPHYKRSRNSLERFHQLLATIWSKHNKVCDMHWNTLTIHIFVPVHTYMYREINSKKQTHSIHVSRWYMYLELYKCMYIDICIAKNNLYNMLHCTLHWVLFIRYLNEHCFLHWMPPLRIQNLHVSYVQ